MTAMHSERTNALDTLRVGEHQANAAAIDQRSLPARLVFPLLITLVANTAIAVLLTVALPSPQEFFSNFVYSQFIGLSILLLYTLPRLAFWPRKRLQPWQATLHLAAAMVVGFVVGSYAASFALDLPPLIQARGFDSLRPAVLVTILASVVCSGFFWMRERVTTWQLQALAERERAEAERARAEAASRQASEAQLNLIRTQLEPHMLFNTLANLRTLMASDPPRAQVMVDHLIAFLRATLSASRHDKVSLGKEFEVLRDYLALISIRMGPRLRYSLTLPAELATVTVLPLLLQPLVENAVRHGVEPAIDGGRIDVRARTVGGRLELVVEDTGVGFTGDREGFGLAQVRERLQTAHGTAAGLTIESPLPAVSSPPGDRVQAGGYIGTEAGAEAAAGAGAGAGAETEIGAGTRVTLVLPFSSNPPGPADDDESHRTDR